MNKSEQHDILTEKETAKYLRIDQRTLRRWRADSSGPECSRLGGKLIRYKRTKVDEWLDKQSAVVSEEQSPQ
jgi:excisionase family DNA binding protein